MAKPVAGGRLRPATASGTDTAGVIRDTKGMYVFPLYDRVTTAASPPLPVSLQPQKRH